MSRGKGVTRQYEKRKIEIMQKAMKLFMVKGFDATSTNDICWAARMTKPSLYHYFSSKNHLLFSVHMHVIESILQPYLIETESIKEPQDRMEVMIRDYTKLIISHPELRFLLHESLTVKDKYYGEIKKEWRRLYGLFRTTIIELQSSGKVAKDLEPSWAALLILGMISWMTFWFDYKSKERVDEIIELTIKMGFQSLGIAKPN
ncbi:MAG: DNA-binding transcriptional repressor AcrR [Syntrophorhabdus sp. PtaU1.Bin058]|nr:MAG: DNA-binding transcriptional repressor AcrR [Syntrophorhabdus sp. PtaU1.Bin058]